jgi:putative transposase
VTVPERPVAGSAGVVFHVVNRAIQGQLLFSDFGEYLAFQRLLARALETVPTRLLAYCLMPNHWHFVLWPRIDGELTAFVRWLTKTHAQSLRHWRGTVGRGAVYQGRFKASGIDTDRYFYTAIRYVERNPVRAGLAATAEDWLWSSASETGQMQGIQLAKWPLPRPDRWSSIRNEVEPGRELEFIRQRTGRNEPLAQPHRREAALAVPDAERVAIPETASPRGSEAKCAATARAPDRAPDPAPDPAPDRAPDPVLYAGLKTMK